MDIVSKINGNTCSATEFNQIPTELEALQTSSGQTSSDAILNQVSIATSRYAANNFYIDSGAANAYVLTLAASMTNPVSATVGYFNGMTIKFRAGNANSGASTVNVNSAGVKNLKQADGTTDLILGQIPTNQDSIFRYNGTAFCLVTPSSFIGFRAYRNGTQAISSGVRTKVQLNAESFDTNGWFDSSTNYRFTPQKAGYYQVNCSVATIKTAKSPVLLDAVIYKNGAEASYHNFQIGSGAGASGGTATAGGADLVYMNGSTDYLELYTLAVYSDGTSPDIVGSGVQQTYFSADFRGA
jgi:hypothetical protein